MSYDEEQQRRSRVVVETPAGRSEREVIQTARAPERQGMSTGAVAALVVGAVALVTIIFLFVLRGQQDTANDNIRVNAQQPPVTQQQPQPPVIVQQPAPVQQPPIVVQQPATTQPAPVIVNQPPATDSSATKPSGTDDSSIQSNIDKKISDDTTISALGVTATVIDGKVTLMGTVDSDALKARVERLVNGVKGVRKVDNKIVVMAQ
jgi:cytoskeletal protein RodZ